MSVYKKAQGNWHGLYKERWGDDIVPDAYAHPAKFARGLIRHIYIHLRDHGYLFPGDTILDPFAGVALGGLDAALLGYNWLGGELEQKFVDLGRQNIELWVKQYRPLWPDSWGKAVLLQGDSRHLGKMIREADGLVSSPPFGSGETRDRFPVQEGEIADCITRAYTQDNQGNTQGNLATMTTSDAGLDAVLTSPPYAAGCAHTGGADPKPEHVEGGEIRFVEYGNSEGQLAAMPEGDLDAGVSSPPYEGALGKAREYVDEKRARADANRDIMQCKAGPVHDLRYSSTPANLGNDSGDNFWTAARQIVDQCYLVLKPGAVAVWVVKRFVRKKQIIDFPDQWRQMCEAAGFETVEWIRAWVVEEHGMQLGLFGESKALRKERKSFFRRLYERNYPENAIDWEDVLIMRRAE